MVSFLLPRSQTLDILECPKRLDVVRSDKEPLRPRMSFPRTLSKSPERLHQRTDLDEKVSRPKSGSRNSWLKSITSSLMSGGGSPRSESAPTPPLDAPTHVRRRSHSLLDSKSFTIEEDPRLPDHMRRPELQLRRIQRREIPPSRSRSNRSSSVERGQRYPLWWAA